MVDQALYREEAERALLCSALLNPSVTQEVGVSPSDFHNLAHAKIWSAMLHLRDKGEAIDPVTVADAADIPITDVLPLMNEVAVTTSAPTYANIIKDYARRRAMVAVAGDIAKLAYGGGDIGTGMAEAYRRLEDTWDTSALTDAALVASELWDRLSGSSPQASPIGTPWLEMNASIGYLQPGEVVVIAARPSMGKTQMLVQIVDHNLREGKRVVIHSLETSEQGIIQRLALLRSGVNGMSLRLGGMAQADLGPYSQELANLMGETDKLFIVHGRQSAEDVCYAVRSLERRVGHVDLVVVDYLQRYQTPGISRVRELGEVLDRFKDLAIDINAPALVASQLNRGVEDRDNKRPLMSDLRESGEIEQTADVVIGLFRDKYYTLGGDGSGPTEVLPLKVRDGARGGTIVLEWNADKVRFESSVASAANIQILSARGVVRPNMERAKAGEGVQVPPEPALPFRQGLAEGEGGRRARRAGAPAMEPVQERRGEVQSGGGERVDGVQGGVLHDSKEGGKGSEASALDTFFGPKRPWKETDYID